MATRNKPELSSHADFLAAHAARVQSVNDVLANDLAEVDRARTRVINAHEAALKAAEADHAAARLERNAEVVSKVIAGLRIGARAFMSSREIGRAETLGRHFRSFEAETQRDLGRALKDELAIAFALEFIEKHPESLPRFANDGAWVPHYGDGLGALAFRANEALRDEFNLPRMQTHLLNLEAGVTKVGSVGQPAGDADSAAAEYWNLRVACLPGDVEEARKQEILKAVKARNIAAHQAEQDLKYRALTGDLTARETIERRGGGALAALFDSAAAVLLMITGRQPSDEELRAVREGRVALRR